MRKISPITFQTSPATFSTVTTWEGMEQALLAHGDAASKSYERAVKSIAALAAGKGDRIAARQYFVAALEAAGVTVRPD